MKRNRLRDPAQHTLPEIIFSSPPHTSSSLHIHSLYAPNLPEEEEGEEGKKEMDAIRDAINNVSLYEVKAAVRKAQNGDPPPVTVCQLRLFSMPALHIYTSHHP